MSELELWRSDVRLFDPDLLRWIRCSVLKRASQNFKEKGVLDASNCLVMGSAESLIKVLD